MSEILKKHLLPVSTGFARCRSKLQVFKALYMSGDAYKKCILQFCKRLFATMQIVSVCLLFVVVVLLIFVVDIGTLIEPCSE